MAAVSPTVPEALTDMRGAFRPAASGIAARVVAAVAIAGGLLIIPLFTGTVHDHWIGKAAIYAIIGLSINVITGHAGQLSLGHQAFVGIGAFMSAFVAAKVGGYFPDPANPVLPPLTVSTANFWLGIFSAAVVGCLMAVVLGLVALRIKGLYLALITLAFGLMAENTVFGIRGFTGGGAGASAPRPALFESEQSYTYLCLALVALFLLIDWRLVRSRGGRAIVALRNDERIAATLGVNVTGYKLLAFATGGLMAGVAGALFAHWNQAVQALDFQLQTALVWVLMAVVGGLGSRAGVVIGSAFFALFPLLLGAWTGGVSLNLPVVGLVIVETIAPLIGALLLLLTLTLYPGGIGQQILPFRRWLAGGPLVESRHEATRLAGFPALLGLIIGLVLAVGPLGWLFGFLVGLAGAAALGVLSTFLLSMYLGAYQRSRRAGKDLAPQPEAEATAPVPETLIEGAPGDGGRGAPDHGAAAGAAATEDPGGDGPPPAASRQDDTEPIAPTGARRSRSRRRRNR